MDTQSMGAPLAGKRALIFGAGGAVGAAAAGEFAAQGATVFLAGRTLSRVEQVVEPLQERDLAAYAAQVDALDEAAVEACLDRITGDGKALDILLNVTGPQANEYGNATATLDLPLEQYLLPLTTLVPAQFITARAAARRMVRQGSGVILLITAIPGRGSAASAAIGSAFGAMESLVRCLAVDLGPSGVRVAGIRSGPMVDTRTIRQSFENTARRLATTPEQVVAQAEARTLLKRLPTAADTARLAAFLASDAARTVTGAILNSTSGALLD